ncbi:hypothetical protein F2Q69_00046472 [Brassica cretica]|uniref:Uncharacterized protein n=1 Tax=Brassica cretica TaxID=69181 RepID=A0A8S9PVN4_BRACR|nr:hypothetical protein F2Q69_00046472 [Brassica cretica]
MRSDLGTSLREVAPRSFLRERPGCVALKTSLPGHLLASDLAVSLRASLGVVSPWKHERPWNVALASHSGRGVSR